MAQDANKTTPILQCHGDIDHMVPFSWGNLTAQFLKSLNPSHEIKKLSGVMHSSSPEVKLRTHDPQIHVKVVRKIKCGIFILNLKSIFWSLHLLINWSVYPWQWCDSWVVVTRSEKWSVCRGFQDYLHITLVLYSSCIKPTYMYLLCGEGEHCLRFVFPGDGGSQEIFRTSLNSVSR